MSLANTAKDGHVDFANVAPAIGPLDTKRLQQRVEERVTKLKDEERDKGKGVTKEGQDIFDALKRMCVETATLSRDARADSGVHSGQEVRWHDQGIIVNDHVIIGAPYNIEDCRGPKAQQEHVNRVKNILQGERKKLKVRDENEKMAGANVGPRKGG